MSFDHPRTTTHSPPCRPFTALAPPRTTLSLTPTSPQSLHLHWPLSAPSSLQHPHSLPHYTLPILQSTAALLISLSSIASPRPCHTHAPPVAAAAPDTSAAVKSRRMGKFASAGKKPQDQGTSQAKTHIPASSQNCLPAMSSSSSSSSRCPPLTLLRAQYSHRIINQ